MYDYTPTPLSPTHTIPHNTVDIWLKYCRYGVKHDTINQSSPHIILQPSTFYLFPTHTYYLFIFSSTKLRSCQAEDQKSKSVTDQCKIDCFYVHECHHTSRFGEHTQHFFLLSHFLFFLDVLVTSPISPCTVANSFINTMFINTIYFVLPRTIHKKITPPPLSSKRKK